MSTVKQGGNHSQVYGGVDQATKPHLVAPDEWLTGTNIRFFNGAQQASRKKVLCNMRPTTTDPILHLCAIPKGYGRSLMVALTEREVYQVTALTGSSAGLEILRDKNILEFATDGRYRRWGTTMYMGNLYFSNELNALRYTDGGQCYKLGENIPSGRYVLPMYDHMWLGWMRKDGHTYPTRVGWSHLYDFSQWTPQATNEADYYDFEEYCSNDLSVRGVTGMAKLGTEFVAYTPSAILNVRYVGLPKVVKVDPLSQEVGNGLPWTLVGLHNRHYFFDIRTFNFWLFTAEGPKPVGTKIQPWLLANMKMTTPEDMEVMWGYYDAANKEVSWVFKSTTSTGALDAYVTFNEATGKWTHGFCENIHAFHPGAFRAKQVSELSGINSALTGKAAQMGVTSDTFSKIYGSANASILRDEVVGDTFASLKYCPGPVLETPDLVYGDPSTVKEIDSLIIHATWTQALNLKVEYSVRDNLEAAVSWVEISQRWTTSLPEKRLSFPRLSGRIFRFRFTPVQDSSPSTTTTTRQILSPAFTMRAELTGSTVEPPDGVAFKKFDGPVYAALPSGDKWYISGRFTKYGNEVEGWVNCAGIARIKADGTIDTTFQPGGVASGGFAISGGFFAPTQLQGAADGGVFCGMSYAYLMEPRLYVNRAAASDWDNLRLNGVTVAPVVKLKADGTVDATFTCATVNGVATTNKFMSFHVHEAANQIYYSYMRNFGGGVAIGEDGFDYGGASAPGAGVDYSTLDRCNLTGTLQKRAFMRGLTSVSSNHETQFMVFVDEDTSKVTWGGCASNQLGGLVIYNGTSYESAAWRMAHLNQASAVPGVIVFDFDLSLHQAMSWAGYTQVGIDAGAYTATTPRSITRGCFRGSIVGASEVRDDPGGFSQEGRWGSGLPCVHKGGWHYNVNLTFGSSQRQAGSGEAAFGFTSDGDGQSNRFLENSPNPGGTSLNLWFQRNVLLEEALLSALTADEEQTTFVMPTGKISGSVSIDLDPPPVGSAAHHHWEVWGNGVLPTIGARDHWDLRGGAAITDTPNHGFSVLASGLGVLDYDGCWNIQVLKAQYDATRTEDDRRTSNDLGVFFTGMLAKFQGTTIFSTSGQLCKLRHNGTYITTFVAPDFGPTTFDLPQDISSGANENFHNKIMCGTLSRSGKYIVVGGRFTQVIIDSGTYSVGHIITLDANTGERYNG